MSNGNMEEMLTQLIQMVGTMLPEFKEMKAEQQNIKAELQEIRSELQEVRNEQQSMKSELQEIKERQLEFELKSEVRHEELLRTIHSIKADQDYIFIKTVRNEREIEKLKKPQ